MLTYAEGLEIMRELMELKAQEKITLEEVFILAKERNRIKEGK